MTQQDIYVWRSDSPERTVQVVQSSWSCRSVAAVDDSPEYFVLDLSVEGGEKKVDELDESEAGNVHHDIESSKLSTLFDEVRRHAGNNASFTTPVKVLLPALEGCFVQENIIQDRFADCPELSAICRLAPENERTSAPPPEATSTEGLASLAEFGVVALIGKDVGPGNTTAMVEAHGRMEEEIRCRLQLAWWQHDLPPWKTLACVCDGPNWKYHKPVWEAAKANRIRLVVIIPPGHWLSEEEGSKLCDGFIPLSFNNDDGRWGERIAEAVKKSGIAVDGIAANSDDHLLPTAQAATILGLPTQPPDAYAVCRDKHAARQLRTSSIQSFSVATEDQAQALINDGQVQYPVIVKPQHGKSSYGVAKVTAASQIMAAVSRILSEFHDTVLIETYISGPELDVNLVLSKGKVLFCEILDDFPSEGDADGAEPSANFLESAMSSPSQLPSDELAMVQSSALESVLAAGFHTGMFHVEGRVVNSQMEYVKGDDGSMQLRKAELAGQQGQGEAAQFVLIEVNARPPAFCCVQATKLTYGIDYYEQWMLAALQDEQQRMAALARGFAFPQHTATGAQYWSHNLIYPNTTSGLFDARAWRELLASNQDILQRYCSAVDSPWEDGEAVPDPATGRTRFLAYFIIRSRGGRQSVLDRACEVEQRVGGVLAGGLVRSSSSSS